jgi:Ca2+-binding EF-hand superfamily protein
MFEHGAKTRDGLLDHHELSQITHFWGTGLSPSDAREIIIQIDSDADGRISFRDFLALWRRANEGDVPLRVRSNLKRTVTQLGLEPRAEKPERLRFAGARGFFEQGMKKHARDCNDN